MKNPETDLDSKYSMLSDMGKRELLKKFSWDDLHWIEAAYLFDYGDAAFLADRIRGADVIPDNVSAFLADIIDGIRTPQLKKSSQINNDINERLTAVISLIFVAKALEIMRGDIHSIADDATLEPIEVKKFLAEDAKVCHTAVMHFLKIGKRNLDGILSDIRKRLKKYPDL